MPGVYICYPFCSQKCTYCNFASAVLPRQLEQQYLDALLEEIRSHAWSCLPDTVYLGGGTPSRIEEADIERLLSAVPGRPWREATLEAAPGSVTAEKASGWRRAGITRVSLGVQSFVDRELRLTGRRHTAVQVERETALLREAGIDEINIDLIAGLAGQTAESWMQSLDWIRRLDPPHVSVYMLEVDADSRLGSEVLAGGSRYGAGQVPAEEEIARKYETAVDRLEELGIQRYEISNFARPGHESLHNLKYWRGEPYAGFGADAHSLEGGWRLENSGDAADYVRRMRQHGSACVGRTPSRPGEERFFVGLRLAEGVRLEPDDWSRSGAAIRRFLAEGLLEHEGGSLRLTRRGVLLSNEVFREFLR